MVAKVEPTDKYKYLHVASGATPIGSDGRAPDENKKKKNSGKSRRYKTLQVEPTPKCKHSTVASGATPIVSACCAPDST
jgi:hypothetical protein